tara:strand:+ start:582 stop:905 length:324 start_codon:yes stop_codon:yes gene_type:complete
MANFPTKFTGSQGLTTDNKQLLQWVSSDSPSASELVLRTIAGESFYETDRALSPRNFLSGQLDELRISTVCRYSGSQFDLQTKQFGRPDLKLKDGSGTYTVKLKQIN